MEISTMSYMIGYDESSHEWWYGEDPAFGPEICVLTEFSPDGRILSMRQVQKNEFEKWMNQVKVTDEN